VPAGDFPPVEHGDAESQVARRVSLSKTPSRQKAVIHLVKWGCEIVAKKLGFSDWIEEEMVSSGSILNLDRITPT
jgi:hypothetical protein